jgi:hypothetical protein
LFKLFYFLSNYFSKSRFPPNFPPRSKNCLV